MILRESKCRSCGEMIVWARMADTKRWNPLDPVPQLGGNVEVKPGEVSGDPWARVVKPDPDVRRYVSHFSSCPDRDTWRRE